MKQRRTVNGYRIPDNGEWRDTRTRIKAPFPKGAGAKRPGVDEQ